MEIAIASLLGFIVGGGTLYAVNQINNADKTDETGIAQQVVVQQLTDLDITKPICKPDYIAVNSNLLCRQITCLQFSRGTDSQTAGKQCEEISNIANTIAIDKHCESYKDPAKRNDCIDLFFKRK